MSKDKVEGIKPKLTMNLCVCMCVCVCLVPLCSGAPSLSKTAVLFTMNTANCSLYIAPAQHYTNIVVNTAVRML